MKVGIIGAGRIGKVHAKNISMFVPEMEIKTIADPFVGKLSLFRIFSGMLSGQTTLYIIHGNGTGALRTAIQKHLRTHKAVKSFRLGRYGEGESGVTVVEFK